MRSPLLASALALCLVSACSDTSQPEPLATSRAPLIHDFDLASNMPPHLAVMFAMAWFGLPQTEPSLPNPDPTYGNWKWNIDSCGGIHSDPSSCTTDVASTPQRSVASRYRPLAGIYSSTGQNEESQRRIDLILSTLRRPCDAGARIDAFAIQLDGTHGTSLHPNNPQSVNEENPLRALEAFLDRADAAGMKNVVMPADDASWYPHWGSSIGLSCDTDKPGCIQALAEDVADMVALTEGHPSALRIAGKPLLLFYIESSATNAADWAEILDKARTLSGKDFYTLGSHVGADADGFYDAFDGLAPWLEFYWWDNSAGATIAEHAKSYAQKLHANILTALPGKPGRVAFAGIAPGFDDFTERWGDCVERQIPHAGQGEGPRDPGFLDGQLDFAIEQSLRGTVLATWDDWTEGTSFEPDVVHGTSMLLHLRKRLGELAGDPDDPSGEAALDQRWTSYGQSRGCDGNNPVFHGTGPVTELACPSADAGAEDGSGPEPQPEAGVDSSPGADAAQADVGQDSPQVDGAIDATGDVDPIGTPGASSDGGCGCRVHAQAPGSVGWLAALAGVLVGRARRRRYLCRS